MALPDEYNVRSNYHCEFNTRQRVRDQDTLMTGHQRVRMDNYHPAEYVFYELFDLNHPRFICEEHLIQRRYGNLEGPQVPIDAFLIRRD